MSEHIRVRWAGFGDTTEGTVVSIEHTDPEGYALVEPMIWVRWDDAQGDDDLDLLTWDDVVEL